MLYFFSYWVEDGWSGRWTSWGRLSLGGTASPCILLPPAGNAGTVFHLPFSFYRMIYSEPSHFWASQNWQSKNPSISQILKGQSSGPPIVRFRWDRILRWHSGYITTGPTRPRHYVHFLCLIRSCCYVLLAYSNISDNSLWRGTRPPFFTLNQYSLASSFSCINRGRTNSKLATRRWAFTPLSRS